MGKQTFADAFPELVGQWNTARNSLAPKDLTPASSKKVWWVCPVGHNFEATVAHRTTRGQGCPYCANKRVLAGFNDLATFYPELIKEWNFDKNNGSKPTDFIKGSGKKVWWVCTKNPDHQWEAQISNRVRGAGCPFCDGRVATPGLNDLATLRPDLASEWHPTLNGDLTPDTTTVASGKDVWWQCNSHPKHTWKAKPHSRNRGTGCPICSGNQVLAGFNDLQTLHPDLALEWHLTKNKLNPTEVTAGSNKKVWWVCSNNPNHTWIAPVANRSKIHSGCPVCSGNKLQVGENDLLTLKPSIAEQWVWELNGEVTPSMVTAGSQLKVWWQCPVFADHRWLASVGKRTSGSGCPYCSNQKTLDGFNDLLTANPDLASQWHPIKNGALKPEHVSASGNRNVWWQCPKDPSHSWKTTIYNRKSGSQCPICSGRKIQQGFNDLATVNPDLAKQWHPTENGLRTPHDITAFSNTKIWWICKTNPEHVWKSTVNNRSNGYGCPKCAGNVVHPGETDLATTNPEIAAQWHPTKNADFTPQEISRGSVKKVWWQCDEIPEHAWRATPNDRYNGNGCPTCAVGGFDPSRPGLVYYIEHTDFRARKIGITNVGVKTDRLLAFSKEGWEIIATFANENGLLVRDVETNMFRWIRKELGLPQHLGRTEMPNGGSSETFSIDGPTDLEVIQKIEALFIELDCDFEIPHT